MSNMSRFVTLTNRRSQEQFPSHAPVAVALTDDSSEHVSALQILIEAQPVFERGDVRLHRLDAL